MRLLEAMKAFLEYEDDPVLQLSGGQRIYKTFDYGDIDYSKYPGLNQLQAKFFYRNAVEEMSWNEIEDAIDIPGIDGDVYLAPHRGRQMEIGKGRVFFRYDMQNGIMYADSVFLDDEDQGHRKIQEIVSRQIPFIMKFKINKVKVTAAFVGKYAWATYGFRASNSTVREWYNRFLFYFPMLSLSKAPETMAQIASITCSFDELFEMIQQKEDRLEQLSKYPYMNKDSIDVVSTALKRIDSALLENKRFYVAGNRFLAGKAFLIESPGLWNGTLNLSDQAQMNHVMAMLQKKEAVMDISDQAYDLKFLQVMGDKALEAHVMSVEEMAQNLSPKSMVASKDFK